MSYVWTSLTVIYLAGVAWGLIMIDASHPGVRIGHALLWPLGPLAFVATIGVLLVAAMIAFPAFGAVALAAGVALWMLAR